MRKFSLSLDDFSPHPRSGLNFESIKWCDKLIEQYDIKINLFVPAAYARLEDIPYRLTENQHWVDKVKKLGDNYRINLHGYCHRRSNGDFYMHKKYSQSNNDEWEFLNYTYAYSIARLMIEEFDQAGLDYTPTFRPPAWKISREAVTALEAHGITCFAGSKEYYEKCKDIVNVKWVNYNWDLTGPCKTTGDIVAFGHTSNWTNNYMNEERYNLIKELLDKEQFDFRFIEDM